MLPLESLVPKMFTKDYNSSMKMLYQTSQDWMKTSSNWLSKVYRQVLQGPVSEYFRDVMSAVEDMACGNETSIIMACVILLLVLIMIGQCRKDRRKQPNSVFVITDVELSNQDIQFDMFDLAKTSYEAGHTQAVIKKTEEQHYDINFRLPTTGLSLFLCACISGHYQLIRYMLKKGADLDCLTALGDSPLYLATYGVLNSPLPDLSVLEELIQAGCGVNQANIAGYTPLHQAASHGNLYVVKYLLMKGADPYSETVSGILPVDSAVNAGHLDVAELLAVDLTNPHVWDIVDPHTPPRISQGLLSPRRRLLMESPPPKHTSAILHRHV